MMKTGLSLPQNEVVVVFHDITADNSAKRGLAACRGGLYWKNRFSTGPTGTWVSGENFVDARKVSVGPNDADIWITPAMQIGLGVAEIRVVFELLLAIRAALQNMGDQPLPAARSGP